MTSDSSVAGRVGSEGRFMVPGAQAKSETGVGRAAATGAGFAFGFGCKRVVQAGGLLGMLLLAGCVLPLPSYVQPIGPQDRMPNGTVEQVAASPKRSATANELATVQRTLNQGVWGAHSAIAVQDMRVEDVAKPIVGFCAKAAGKGAANASTTVYGMLKNTDKGLQAFDFHFDDFAALACREMKFY